MASSRSKKSGSRTMKRGGRIPPAELRKLWDKVPKMKTCAGKCSYSCGPLPVSSLEREIAEARAGHELRTMRADGIEGTEGSFCCNMLTKDGRCSIYSVRPLICRIWGTTPTLPCPEGCEPERWLSDFEALELFEAIEKLAEDHKDYATTEMIRRMSPIERKVWEEARDKKVAEMMEGLEDRHQEKREESVSDLFGNPS